MIFLSCSRLRNFALFTLYVIHEFNWELRVGKIFKFNTLFRVGCNYVFRRDYGRVDVYAYVKIGFENVYLMMNGCFQKIVDILLSCSILTSIWKKLHIKSTFSHLYWLQNIIIQVLKILILHED